jgi:hypothetical protein
MDTHESCLEENRLRNGERSRESLRLSAMRRVHQPRTDYGRLDLAVNPHIRSDGGRKTLRRGLEQDNA